MARHRLHAGANDSLTHYPRAVLARHGSTQIMGAIGFVLCTAVATGLPVVAPWVERTTVMLTGMCAIIVTVLVYTFFPPKVAPGESQKYVLDGTGAPMWAWGRVLRQGCVTDVTGLAPQVRPTHFLDHGRHRVHGRGHVRLGSEDVP